MAVSRDNRRGRTIGASWIRAPRRILRAAIAAAPLLTALPATAQWFGDGPIPLEAVVRIVTRHGFTGFSPPRLEGDVYIVHAIGDGGERVRLVIDAHDGRILRPLGLAERFGPARPGRVPPRDYAVSPDPDDEDDEPIERLRPPGFDRGALVPPRSIGRPPRLDRELSRRLDEEDERDEIVEPYRPPATGRELDPAPTMRSGPALERRSVRIEPPASDPAAPAAPRAAPRPRPAGPAPAPVEAVKPDRPADAKPSTPATPTPPATTAAVPAPVAPKETAPVTPAAPVAPTAPSEPAKPEAAKPAPVSVPQAPKPQPSPAQVSVQPPQAPGPVHAGPPPKVRIIEGVTPVLPQGDAEKK